MEGSDFFKSFLLAIQRCETKTSQIRQIICFGIGHFSQCTISRHQLAFILAIRGHFNLTRPITFHEPILNIAEIQILKELDCAVYAENLEGKVPITPSENRQNTLVYAPHCPKQLTNNFLWKNWSIDALASTILIANSFANTIDSTPSRFLEIDAKYILKLAAHTHEDAIENNFKFADIFNDTAIHYWNRSELNDLDQSIWTENVDEPKYNETIELITTDLIAKLNVQ